MCVTHSPEHRAAMDAARAQGGARTKALVKAAQAYGIELEADVASPAGLRNVLAQTIKAVAGGRLSSAAADSITRAVNAAVVIGEAEREVALAELLKKVQELQADRGR